jgi:LmbE family N-acetylglucosaminyl deacetylase
MPTSPDLHGSSVLALHAHPDDEAIFTGLTLRRLADAGARVVLVLATSGELGTSRVPLAPGETISQRRVAELERSAELLGVSRLVLLGQRDSGLPGWVTGAHPRALASTDPRPLARRIAALAEAENAATLIYDDAEGIYGHPDHRGAHRVGRHAAALIEATSYLVTVDRDQLARRAPGRHLVHGAARAAAVPYGRPSEEITLAVTGEEGHLASKYTAIMAHASQVAAEQLPADEFPTAYGTEWFRRVGEPGPLDQLADPANRPTEPVERATTPVS